MDIKQKKKEQKKKEREQKKKELEQFHKMFMYDENGNKRTKVQINELILKNLKNDFKENKIETYNKIKTNSKYNYRKRKEEIEREVDGKLIKRDLIIETDF